MNSKVEFALKTFVASNEDVFGVKSEFITFVEENGAEPSKGAVSTTIFGKIKYLNDAGAAKKTPSLAVKCTYDRNSFMEFYVMPTISNEVLFYTKVLPFFQQHLSASHLFPRFYGNLSLTYSNNIESISIMENLNASGYRPYKRGPFLDQSHLSLMARKLAELHASSFNARKFDRLRFQCVANAFAIIDFSFIKEYLQSGNVFLRPPLQILRENPKYASRLRDLDQFLERLGERYLDSVETEDDSSFVLCHNDFGSRNMFFKYENDVPIDAKLIDTGHCRLCSPAQDLTYFLIRNTDKQTRSHLWDNLIDIYYERLMESCDNIPSKESIVEKMPKFLPLFCAAASVIVTIEDAIAKGTVVENNLNSLEEVLEVLRKANCKIQLDILTDLLDRTDV